MPTVLGKAPKAGRPKKEQPTAVGCRPEDRAMLQTPAGQELVEKATAGMMGELAKGVPVPSEWPFPPSADPLDALVQSGPQRALQLALWKIRHEYPEGLKIVPEDIAKMAACTEHLKVQPRARVWRRIAIPPHDGVPAIGNRRAIPPFAGMPAAPFVMIQLVDDLTTDAFRLMENNEEDNAMRIAKEKRDQAKVAMPGLISAVRNALARGETSDSLINELCEASAALAKLS